MAVHDTAAEDLRTFELRVTTVRRGFERLVYRTVQRGVDHGMGPRGLALPSGMPW